jgi:NADH dehydrogenase
MNDVIDKTIIIGGGFTGLFTALHLSHQNYQNSVILIDQNDRFCFKPLLYEYFIAEMDDLQVLPKFTELLEGSGVTFVQDKVENIDLQQREVKLSSGDIYKYNNLVLAVGSVPSYFNVQGAQEAALPFYSQTDAIAIDHRLYQNLQTAVNTSDENTRNQLLTIAVVGGGPTGVEMSATLADLLPHWYNAMGGNSQQLRIVLLNHGEEILQGDINNHLREIATEQLQKRTIPVELLLGAKVTAVLPNAIKYEQHGQVKTLPTCTTIWTAGTTTHPLIENLAIPTAHRNHHGKVQVNPTLQLLDYPEVFAGGDCAVIVDNPLPPTAQVAYQQGKAIAHNLKALSLKQPLQPVQVNIRGTLLKLGLNQAAANIYNLFEVTGEIAHLIRQGTYLELLPTPIHNFQATREWLDTEIFHRYLSPSAEKTATKAVELAGSAAISLLIARKLVQLLGNRQHNT